MNPILLAEFTKQFSKLIENNDFKQLQTKFPHLNNLRSHPEECLKALLELNVSIKEEDYYYQKLMAPVFKEICFQALREPKSDTILSVAILLTEELDEFAKDYSYAPLEFIAVLAETLNLSVNCINLETIRDLVERQSSQDIKFSIFYDPDSNRRGVNAHYYVHPDHSDSTYADGNCLYMTFAQMLKWKYMKENAISNDYYKKLFSYLEAPKSRVSLAFQPSLKQVSIFSSPSCGYLANAMMTSSMIGMGLILSGILTLDISLGMSIAAGILLLAIGMKLANLAHIEDDKLSYS